MKFEVALKKQLVPLGLLNVRFKVNICPLDPGPLGGGSGGSCRGVAVEPPRGHAQ